MEQEHLPQPQAPRTKIDKRQAERHIVMLRLVLLEHHRMHRRDAYISEISVYGCRFYCKGKLQVGDVISLCLDNIQMTQATIIWRKGAVAGCRFSIPVGMDIITQMAFNLG